MRYARYGNLARRAPAGRNLRAAALRDHVRDRDAAVVAERDVPAGHPELGRDLGGPAVQVQPGRPPASRRTSASRWASPGGAPSALATASLAANRAASDGVGRSRSTGVNSRSRSAGVRSSAAPNRATSTTSTPMPTIMWPG